MITLNHPSHGTFTVKSEHLDSVILENGFSTLFHLQRWVNDLVGLPTEIDGSHAYSDLRRGEAMIILSYLTGGAA